MNTITKRDDIMYVVVLAIIIKLFIFEVGFLGSHLFYVSEPYFSNAYHFEPRPEGFFGQWSSWDTQWFLKIANEGYPNPPASTFDISSRSFFPLYPLLIWLFSLIVQHNILAGIILSNVASIIACVFLYLLVKTEYSKKISKRTIFYLLIFPTAFFFSAVYSESLFLMFTVMAFYYARKNIWALAGLFGFLASLTRVMGVFLVFPLLIEFFVRNPLSVEKKWKLPSLSILWTMVPALGTLAYFTYLKLHTGSFFAFFEAQKYWGRTSYDVTRIIETITHGYIHYPLYSIVDIATAITFVILLFFLYKKVRLSYFTYAAFCVLIPLSTGTFMSIGRMVLVAFPFFMLFAIWGEKKWVHYCLTFLFGAVLIFSTMLFVNHYWIA